MNNPISKLFSITGNKIVLMKVRLWFSPDSEVVSSKRKQKHSESCCKTLRPGNIVKALCFFFFLFWGSLAALFPDSLWPAFQTELCKRDGAPSPRYLSALPTWLTLWILSGAIPGCASKPSCPLSGCRSDFYYFYCYFRHWIESAFQVCRDYTCCSVLYCGQMTRERLCLMFGNSFKAKPGVDKECSAEKSHRAAACLSICMCSSCISPSHPGSVWVNKIRNS